MLKLLACTALILLVCSACLAEPEAYQITTTSWHGLSGLYVVPTARTLGQGNWALGYNESRHVENVWDGTFLDRQVRATVNYGVTHRIEISANYIRDLFHQEEDHFSPVLSNQGFDTFGIKWQMMGETRQRPAIAFAVRDILNDTQNVEPLEKVGNGTKYFLLASKRLVYREETGRFVDGHLGVTYNYHGFAGLFGTEIAISPTMSFIAEGMWDAPYLNFRDIYLYQHNNGASDQPGRFIFDSGLRIYPDVLPGMAIDLAFVADGQPEFSWGFSYVARM